MEEVTGSVGRPIAREALKQMFPDIMGTHMLTGTTTVDYLIGLGKASWQPQRVKRRWVEVISGCGKIALVSVWEVLIPCWIALWNVRIIFTQL